MMSYFQTQSVMLFNFLCGVFGIDSQVIDFTGIVGGDGSSDSALYGLKRQPNYCRKFYYVCGIAFALSYPIAAWRLFSNHHFWAPKSINLYVNYFYYSSRYFVVVSIFFMQFRYCRESIDRQFAMIKIFHQIHEINQRIANGSFNAERKRLTMALNVIDWWQMVKLVAAIACYICTNYLKLTYVFLRPDSMNTYDIIWFYYANIFIRLYASMFSISILQQAKIFELLNQTIKAIKNAVDESSASTAVAGPSNDRRFIKSGEHAWQHREHSRGAFEKDIKLLMKLHERLRTNNLKLDKLHSIQAFSVVANGFMNSVSQVKYCFLITHTAIVVRHGKS